MIKIWQKTSFWRYSQFLPCHMLRWICSKHLKWCNTTNWNAGYVNNCCLFVTRHQFHVMLEVTVYNFNIILGYVVPCQKLRWTCQKHSNDVAQQIVMQRQSTIFVLLSHDMIFMSRWRLHNTIFMSYSDKPYLVKRWSRHSTCIQMMLHDKWVSCRTGGYIKSWQ